MLRDCAGARLTCIKRGGLPLESLDLASVPLNWSIPPRAVLAALAIHVLWGGNPVAVKLGLEAFPPLWSGLLRFALGSLCVYAWARFARIPVLPPREEWPALAGLGLLFTVLTRGAGLGHPLGSEGDWWVLASACLLGLRLALSGRYLRRMNEVRLTLWMMLLSLPLFAAGALAWETARWERVDGAVVAGILYQGIVIAGLAFTVNFYLIRRYTPSVVISFNFVSPVAGVLLGMAILGEQLTWGLAGGMALVALGLVLIARR
jgi:drug/metabolite transporter (DMT)-like permease